MLAVPVACRPRKTQDDHVGPETPDGPDYVGKDAVVPPLRERFRGCFGVAEIDGAAEELLCTVNPASGQQFLRADQAEQIALLGSDQVLPALPASERKITGAHMAPAGQICENGGVL